MARSYWLVNSNRSRVKGFIKNKKQRSINKYILIDTGEVIYILSKETPVIKPDKY